MCLITVGLIADRLPVNIIIQINSVDTILRKCNLTDMDTKPLFAAIEKRAFEARISLTPLAKLAGVSPASISSWRKTGGSIPSVEAIGKLEAALDALERERAT